MPGHLKTTAATKAAVQRDREEVFLTCFTVTHPELAQPLRMVSNTEDIVRNTKTYVAMPLEVGLPDDDPDRPPRVPVSIENWGEGDLSRLSPEDQAAFKTPMEVFDTFVDPPEVDLEVIMASAPDEPEMGPIRMQFTSVEIGEAMIDGELSADDGFAQEPYPGPSFGPKETPGLHR
ncbi:DUF1833 family protein [Magnetovibrio sp.]|uniref:DUF1833 family protein n=1 Tax=Magnetovibrio sp. TaxID=2024836 RepID=UPI002F94D996